MQCAICGLEIDCPPHLAGAVIQCPRCNETLRVPEAAKPRVVLPPPAAPPPPPPPQPPQIAPHIIVTQAPVAPADDFFTAALKGSCGLFGCGCLLMILGIVGPIVAIILLALADAS